MTFSNSVIGRYVTLLDNLYFQKQEYCSDKIIVKNRKFNMPMTMVGEEWKRAR